MNELDIIKQENEYLKRKNQELEERLKKYTNGENHKRYYEKNKEKYKELGSNYLQKLKEENPEKLKEYRQRAKIG
jgi:5-methylcytosine-specific restriction endonuclease McrBC GTP-binding regulatory subunit McrB